MKMSILSIEYMNIRKLNDLKISFLDSNGKIINNSFIMMANGTGKTTTMKLIKGLFDGSASDWNEDEVRSFAPIMKQVDTGEFATVVLFDETQYKYFLSLDYKKGIATIKTTKVTTGHGGLEEGRHFPDFVSNLFTEKFVRRFVFDGEQAEKTMDSSSNEAEETIKYLYRLDKLDEIVSRNQRILIEIQEAEGRVGSKKALENLRTRQDKLRSIIEALKLKSDCLKVNIEKGENDKIELNKQKDELDKNYKDLNEEKQRIINERQRNEDAIDAQVVKIIELTKIPYLINQEFANRMNSLGNGMTKLKLPKNSSKDFFLELADAPVCICGRIIGKEEKNFILDNAEKYLGSDQQAILNTIKNNMLDSVYDERLETAFLELANLRIEENRLQTRFNDNAEKLLKAGGDEAKILQTKIEKLSGDIAVWKDQVNRIESTDEYDDELTEENNIHKAENAYKSYEEKIAAATRTKEALYRQGVIEKLVLSIRERATDELKQEIIRKTNEKISKVITDDFIEIENIDRYIKLKGKDGASEGQTLGIAYCFLGTLFEDAELEFPFIIDSPTGKMDFEKRQAVASIIPKVFNQTIAFVQSAEVERFADRFYDRTDSQFLTVIASSQGDDVKVHKGVKFFDSYQHEHRGDEE